MEWFGLFFFIDLLIRTQKPNSVTWSETHLFEHWSPFSRTTPDPVNRSRLASVPPPPPHWRTNAPKGTWFDDFNNETVKLILMKYVFKFGMEAMHVTYGLRNDFPFSLFWMWRYIGVYIRVRKHKSGTSVADFSSSPLRCLQFPSDANLPQASSPILISISITIYMGMSVCKRRGWRELSLHLHYSE